jgi:hypothetical protein
MPGHKGVLLALGAVLASSFALAPGCGGTILSTGADCSSVCGHLGSCEGALESTVADCTASCQTEEAHCAAVGEGAPYQALLDCVGAIDCQGAPQLGGGTYCMAEIQAVAACGSMVGMPVPLPRDASFDIPPIEFDAGSDATVDAASDTTSFDSISPDVGIEGGPEAGTDGPASDAADAEGG